MANQPLGVPRGDTGTSQQDGGAVQGASHSLMVLWLLSSSEMVSNQVVMRCATLTLLTLNPTRI